MLALPKKWVKEMELSSGDEVTVKINEESALNISPLKKNKNNKKEEATIETSLTDNDGNIVRKLISTYVLGYNIINIKAKEGKLSSKQRDTIKIIVRGSLIGAEVISDSLDMITIQVLISFTELNVENAIKRMFLIANSMQKDSIESLNKLDKDAAKGVIKSDDEVDRFSLYIIRQLKMAIENKQILKEIGLEKTIDCLAYRLIVKSIERIADHSSRIAKGVLLIQKPLNKEILEEINKMNEFAIKLVEESALSLYKRQYKNADSIVDKAKSIEEMKQNILDEVKIKELDKVQVISLILEDIQRIAEYSSDVAEMVLNITAEKVILKNPKRSLD
tara:strand:- start:895 stop:1896 length:1002 start_codon:yes stop_codon:yes gene_type:complete